MLTGAGEEGVDALFLSLNEKLKKEGTSYAEAGGDTISQHADKNVVMFLQEIANFRKQALASSGEWTAATTPVKVLAGDVARLSPQVKDIQAQLVKKLLQSQKYKAKIGVYEEVFVEVALQVNGLRSALKQCWPRPRFRAGRAPSGSATESPASSGQWTGNVGTGNESWLVSPAAPAARRSDGSLPLRRLAAPRPPRRRARATGELIDLLLR